MQFDTTLEEAKIKINELCKDINDVEDYVFERPLTSGLPAVDMTLGGIRMGELTVLIGRSGEGKTTLLTQLLISLAGQNIKTYIMNGETNNKKTKRNLILQCAHKEIISTKRYPKLNISNTTIEPESERKIKEWLSGKFYLHNNDTLRTDDIIKSMQVGMMAYDAKVFVIDNLMIAESSNRGVDKNEQQKEVVKKLNDFANKFDVHVILVAHVNKESVKSQLSKYSISGSSDITNIGHNILAVEKLTPLDKRYDDLLEATGNQYDGIVTCFKNREYGHLDGAFYPMKFDHNTKRFYNQENGMHREKPVGWESDLEWSYNTETGEYTYRGK